MINNKLRKNDDGAIIIEASIFLPLFLFLFLTFYSVVNICLTEAKVQNALSKAAKQVSSLSYLYSFTGLKDKNDELFLSSKNTKTEMNDVVDSFFTFTNGVQGAYENGKNAVEKISTADGLSGIIDNKDVIISDAKSVKDNIGTIQESGSKIINYFKTNFGTKGGLKSFALSLLKVAASDSFEYLKNFLGGIVARKFCEPYFITESEIQLFNDIDFSKSLIFPENSKDIIMVAEYNVRIVPYLPIDLNYRISQQAITRGWLDGDGGNVVKSEATIKSSYVRLADNIWTDENNVIERSKQARDDKKAELSELGYKEVAKDNNNLVYNSDTNTVAVIASSNLMYGKKSMDEITDAEIEEMILNNMAKVPAASSIKYKENDGNGHISTKEARPYEKGEYKKEIYLIVPSDKGYEERIMNVYNNMKDKRGIELKVEAKYGAYFATGS